MEVDEKECSTREDGSCLNAKVTSNEDPWSNEEDFGEFQDFEVKEDWSNLPKPSLPLPARPNLSVQDIINSIEPKVVSVISSNFKEVLNDVDESETESSSSFEDPIWSQLQTPNDSPSMSTFNWSSSKANINLMSSLRIDSRNILFDGKWKSRTLPSFMESTAQLLEPTKVEAKVSLANHKNSSEEEQSVLPVEFDWKDSCLTDPLENNQGIHSTLDFLLANYTIDSSLKELQKYYNNVSKVNKNEKTANIVDSFPLLNFMQSSTLIFPINGCDPKL